MVLYLGVQNYGAHNILIFSNTATLGAELTVQLVSGFCFVRAVILSSPSALCGSFFFFWWGGIECMSMHNVLRKNVNETSHTRLICYKYVTSYMLYR